ncbi:MAG: hypothetical protein EOP07_03870 [Proteobacteria bacterium]|nr:MAG: hypothetical protein EOP07_03870 [Pseudomonadota bacterium]
MSDLFKLKNGTVLISTEAPGGIYNSAQLKKIAELCSKELAIVKATEDQRLALFVKESEVARVTAELKTTGLGFRNYQSGLHQPVSCLGELCETHEQPALTTAMDLTRLIADLKLQSSLKIGINGCARCCTPCHTLDISVVGEASGYRISLGGKTSQFPELASFFAESVPAEKLPKLLTNVIEIFQSKAEEGESFAEVLDRCGVEDFVAALAPYSQDAAARGGDPFAIEESAIELSPQGESDDEMMEIEHEPETASDFGSDLDSEISFEVEPEAPEGEESEAVFAMDSEISDLAMPMEDSQAEELPEAELSFEPELSVEMMELEIEEHASVSEDMNFDMTSDSDHSDIDEIPIGSHPKHDLSDDVKVSDDDLMSLEMDSVDAEPEMISMEMETETETEMEEISEETSPSIPALVDEDYLELEIEEDPDHESETAFDAEAEMVTAALDQENELEISEPSELEMEELEFDDSALMSEELMIHEPDLLDENEDLEADVPHLSQEITEISELDDDLIQSDEMDASELLAPEGDEGDMMSSEEEQRFEQKIQASIEEEKKMRDGIEEDVNLSARADALRMLEAAGQDDEEDDLGVQAPSPTRSASTSSKAFEFDGFDVDESNMRVHFSSGAYIDVQLDSLEMGRSKVIRMGREAITVTHEADGYSLEVDGMRMFYPRPGKMRAAS